MDESKSSEEPRFQIKKWNAVALWSWDVAVEQCAICKSNITEHCIECQANENSTTSGDCNIAWGNCNHAFHLHCISRWLKDKRVCPLCHQEWEIQRVEKYSGEEE